MFFKWKSKKKMDKEDIKIINRDDDESSVKELEEIEKNSKIDKVPDELIALALKDLLAKDDK